MINKFSITQAGNRPNVALAHHWMHVVRGGEKVLEQFALLFPNSTIYTLFYRRRFLRGMFAEQKLCQSVIGWLPGIASSYRYLLPVFPFALKTLRVSSKSDFILSCDASIVKGLTHQDSIRQCCYCCSPPRYLFDLRHQYAEGGGKFAPLKRVLIDSLAPPLQRFDVAASSRVDTFVTLSEFVKERIARTYSRDSFVIPPPVAVDDFSIEDGNDGFYLIVSALVAYKRIELAVKACNQLKRKLVVIGDGPERARLVELAGPTVSILGPMSPDSVKRAYQRCRAFLFPGIEDFGITALEAQAAGRPVIGIRAGALVETVQEWTTGVFFDSQTVEALVDGIERFEADANSLSPLLARQNALQYRPSEFRRKLKDFLTAKYPDLFAGYRWPL